MSLTKDDIDTITKLLDESSFDELRLEMGDLKLHVRRKGASSSDLPRREIAAPVPEPAVVSPAPDASPPPLGPNEIDIPSPLLGIFYRAPKPGEPPFVEIGQQVEDDTIIGIIEVMKLMNSARAGVRGEVVAIHAANATMVEFDQPLIRVRLAG